MIFVTQRLPVNAPGEPHLDRAAVWEGLVLKANNALPYVPRMTACAVVARYDESSFDREIESSGGRKHTERITLDPPYRVVFTRIAGPIRGVIVNEIEGPDDDLSLRFSFALVLPGVEAKSPEEKAYAQTLTSQYQSAIEATLKALRRRAVENPTRV